MSGIDQFLAQHYGTVPTEPTQEDLQKVAQAELFLKLAAQHGVDINQLNDAQVNELWNQVFGETKLAEDEEEEKREKAKREHELAKEEAKESQAKFAEADYMGRIMAHAYVDELRGIAEQGGLDFAKEAGERWDSVKRYAGRAKELLTGEKAKQYSMEAKELREAIRGISDRAERKGALPALKEKHLQNMAERKKVMGARIGAGVAGVGALGGVGAGVYHALSRKGDGEAPTPALDDAAAEHAVKKAAAYGFDPEEAIQRISAVLTLGPDPSDKIAYVEDLDSAIDVRSSELLELAGYPIDWTGAPFEKEATAREKYEAVKGFVRSGAKGEGIGEAADQVLKGFGRRGGLSEWETKGPHLKYWGKELGKRVGRTGAVYGGALGTVGGVGHGIRRLVKGRGGSEEEAQEKESSVLFDNAAAELALVKAAEAGWDANEVIERLNSLFTLGYEGNPEESQKVAYAQTGEQALTMRAMELLELAGYPINW